MPKGQPNKRYTPEFKIMSRKGKRIFYIDKNYVIDGGRDVVLKGEKYENQKKYIHIFDGKTGFPVENEIESVTIICENGLYADTLSTALFIIGSENAVSFWRERKDFQMIILQKDGSILYTSPLESQIEILSEFSEICVIDWFLMIFNFEKRFLFFELNFRRAN